MNNKYKLLMLLIFFQTTILLSQYPGGRGGQSMKGIISGYILDSLDQKPIEYAAISLRSIKTNNIETGGVTDETGNFKIRDIPMGKYDVIIEFIGYETRTINDLQVNPRSGLKKDLGNISINKSMIIAESINVFEDKPVFEFETDKLVYNSSEDIISDSGTAEDVLNKVPMVTVDLDGEVSLRGNPNVKILVNGRPNRTGEGGKSVDNIPASLIDKVEVITSPSAKYDPDGMAGIINIVLKKGKYEGVNGSVKINGKTNDYADLSDMNGFTAYGNYKGEKWNFYSSLNINNRVRNVDGYRNVITTYTNYPDSLEDSYFNFLNKSDRIGKSIKFGTDYSINDYLILNAEINYDKHYHSGKNEQNYSLPTQYQKIIHEEDGKDNYNIEGYFDIKQTFNNPDREFNVSISYDFQTELEYESLSLDTTTLNQRINNTDIDLSYKHPLNENTKIELGYDGKINDNYEEMNFQLTDYDDAEFNGKNIFGYKRQIHGFFLEYDYTLNESFSIKPSFRYEYINKDISFESINNGNTDNDMIYAILLDTIGIAINDSVRAETYTTKEGILYPDLHFTYNLTEKQSIQFGLSKRVNRPGDGGHGGGSRQIRPFPRDVYSDNFIFLGNPFLQPEFSTQFDLSFKSPIPMGFAYINLYYHQLENVIEWYDDDRFEGRDILTFKNADSGQNMGVEIFTMLMGQTLGGGYNLSKLEDPSGDYELNGNSQRITIYNRINLPEKYIKVFSFEFGFFFMKMAVPGGNLFGNKGTMWGNMGISKSLLDESLEISLGIDNLFGSKGFQMKRNKPLYDGDGIEYGNEFTDVSTNRGGRTFKLNFIYRFGKMQEENRRQRGMRHGGGDGSMDMGY